MIFYETIDKFGFLLLDINLRHFWISTIWVTIILISTLHIQLDCDI